jgi:hypothetical protein
MQDDERFIQDIRGFNLYLSILVVNTLEQHPEVIGSIRNKNPDPAEFPGRWHLASTKKFTRDDHGKNGERHHLCKHVAPTAGSAEDCPTTRFCGLKYLSSGSWCQVSFNKAGPALPIKVAVPPESELLQKLCYDFTCLCKV